MIKLYSSRSACSLLSEALYVSLTGSWKFWGVSMPWASVVGAVSPAHMCCHSSSCSERDEERELLVDACVPVSVQTLLQSCCISSVLTFAAVYWIRRQMMKAVAVLVALLTVVCQVSGALLYLFVDFNSRTFQ